jgi:beta-glucosidase
MSDGTSGVRFQKGSDSAHAPGFLESISGDFDSEAALRNTYEATCFPSGSTIACSWDRALVRHIGNAIAQECRLLGIDLLLGPGMNIRRHPLTARNFEYYSEDPRLTGELACAMVDGVQEMGIGTSVKHFACHNSDTRRTRVDAIVDERALREIYLAAFERVVRRSKPTTVMTAYNKINGVKASENRWLLDSLLRKEWGFEGAVVSDWGAVSDVVAATEAGLDLQMPESPSSSRRLASALGNGALSEAALDRRVRNILRLEERLAVLATTAKAKAGCVPDAEARHELARLAAEGSIVLLKNESGLLPLEPRKGLKKIAIIGHLAIEPLYQGTGCAIVHARRVDSPWENLVAGKPEGIELDYAEGYRKDDSTDEGLLTAATTAAETADVAIVFAGSFLPEESDRYNRTTMNIESGHERLIETVSKAAKRVIVVLAAGDSVHMPWIGSVSSVFLTGFGGEAMGSALADIIYGRKNPSGKLAATMPTRLQDCPSFLSFPGDEFHLRYDEGLYVGYRYYDARGLEPLFPFGFGLSYTRFSYANLRLSTNAVEMPTGLSAFVDITNEGEREGCEIAQLYVSQRRPRLPRPPRELKGFEKISLLPGETKTAEFRLEAGDFAYFDSEARAWVVDSDQFTIEIGASSRDIRLSAPLSVKSANAPARRLDVASGFQELFEDERAKRMFFDFLVEKGLLSKRDIDERLERKLEKSFWGLFSFMDMHSSGQVGYDELKELIGRINAEISR